MQNSPLFQASPAAIRFGISRRGAVERVVELVAKARNVPVAMILSRKRCRIDVSRARQLAMYLAHVILGESLTRIGFVFGRDRTTVSHACGLIEDMRDDPAFDAAVTELEMLLQDEEGACHG